ncbi:hypothetical protein KKG72_04720 [bacterium]|nr:hypothetical protein [bacterium]
MKKIIITALIICNLFADYNNLKIQDYVNIVSIQNDINIATDKNIEKEFNFYINKEIDKQVSIEVLQELLDSNGFILQKKSNNYYIIKSKEDLLINKIEIFNIKFADTKQIKENTEEILKGYFRNIKTIKMKNHKQEITPFEERKSGANNSTTQVEETEERINYAITVLDNKTISVTYKDEFVPQVMRSIIDSMDFKPTRIRVKVKIYEVSTDALKEYSTDLGLSGQIGTATLGGSTSSSSGIINLGAIDASLTIPENTFSLSAAITALEKKGKAKITAEPSVLLYEGKSSKLIEGKTYPIRTDTTQVSNTNTTTSSSYINKETGLILDINFSQFRTGMIYLKLNLNINDVENYDPGQNQIITIKRELTNELIIKPGDKVDLAGLNRKTDSIIKGGIPFLRDIPYLGVLFSFKKEKNDENMLVLQLSADIVQDGEITQLPQIKEEIKK